MTRLAGGAVVRQVRSIEKRKRRVECDIVQCSWSKELCDWLERDGLVQYSSAQVRLIRIEQCKWLRL